MSEHQIPGIRPYFEGSDDALREIARALASGQVSNNGPNLQRFERLLAEYLGAPEAVVVSTGFEALLLSLKAMGLPSGKVILPAYTYIATLNAIVQAGFQPLFCDIEPNTFALNADHLAELLDRCSDVRCIVPVNVFGVPPDLARIRKLADRSACPLLYDNAHGFGTEVNGLRIPGEPDVQALSLHATKALPAVEGGLVISNDARTLSTVRRLRNHGLGSAPSDTTAGFNSKMDEIRAIIGIHSLNHFPESLARRRGYGERLRNCFARFPDVYDLQAIPDGVSSNYQNLGVCCRRAAELGLPQILDLFKDRGIGVRSYFDPPLYKIPGFALPTPLPVTEMVWRTLISVPIHSRMSERVLERIEYAISDVANLLR